MKHAKEKNVPIWHRNLLKFCQIPRPHPPYMTRQKHRQMTHIIQVKGKINQTSVFI